MPCFLLAVTLACALGPAGLIVPHAALDGLFRDSEATASPAAARQEVTFSMRTFADRTRGCGDDGDSTCVTVDFTWPEVVAASSPAAMEAINATIRDFLGRPVGGLGRQPTPRDVLQALHRQLQEKIDTFDYILPWYVERRVTVMRSDSTVFALRMTDYGQTTGVRPYSTTHYANFHPATGEQFELDELLIEGGHEQLIS